LLEAGRDTGQAVASQQWSYEEGPKAYRPGDDGLQYGR